MRHARTLLLALGALLIALPTAGAQVPSLPLQDLPLTEIAVKGDGAHFVVFLTGDGGWMALDKGVSARLVARGIPVVGFNQRDYLWNRKTPEKAGADLARVITTYRSKWGRDSVVIVGYSRGAGIAPFAVNRLPAHLRETVTAVVLIGAEHGANFQFHLRDILRTTGAPDDLPVMPELRKLGATSVLCFYGDEEADTLCPELGPPAVVVRMTGGHHLDGAYAEIGNRIVQHVTGAAR